MLIKVTRGQLVTGEHTVGIIQVAKRGEAERLYSSHAVDTKKNNK